MIFSKDVKIGKINVAKGDHVFVNINALHYNQSQWRDPQKYIPERFDSESEWFLTPDGNKRHPFAFCPFSGGMRVCFGKTFAELSLLLISTFVTQMFDFEFAGADKEKYSGDKFPIA